MEKFGRSRLVCACFAMSALIGISGVSATWSPACLFQAGVSFAADAVSTEETEILDLETAQATALEQNPSVEAAAQRVRQAKERIDQAKAFYWPWLDASASVSRVELSNNAKGNASALSSAFPGARLDTDSPEDYYNADLTASWIIFDGFERKFNTAATIYGYQETKASRREVQRLLLSAVSQAYYSALLARENIRIAEADQVFNRKQLKDAQARLRVGTGSLSDVLNFEVQINTAKSNLIAAKRSYQVALYGLASLMGVSDARFETDLQLAPLDDETPAEMDAPPAEPLIDISQKFRPDLIGAEYAVLRSNGRIGVEKSNFYPTLALTGVLDGERKNSGRLEADDFGNTVALSLSYDIFSGGLYRARLNEARYAKMEAEKNFEETLIAVKAEVREAAANLSSAQEQLVLQRSNASLVRKNRDLVEKEYAAGQTSLVRLNEAQRDLVGAEARLALALVSLRQAWQEVKAATGEILASFVDMDVQRAESRSLETDGRGKN